MSSIQKEADRYAKRLASRGKRLKIGIGNGLKRGYLDGHAVAIGKMIELVDKMLPTTRQKPFVQVFKVLISRMTNAGILEGDDGIDS